MSGGITKSLKLVWVFIIGICLLLFIECLGRTYALTDLEEKFDERITQLEFDSDAHDILIDTDFYLIKRSMNLVNDEDYYRLRRNRILNLL